MSKRGNYAKWTQQQLDLAVQAVSEKTLGLNAASRRFEVPKATIKRHVEEKNKRSKTRALGRLPVFSAAMEKELAAHILLFEERMFGLTIKDVRRLAFEVAEKHAVEHTFNTDKKIAGKAWYYGFMSRHNELTLRQPESTSMQRIKGFTEERVNKFFTILEGLVDEKKITGSKVYNVDESGFTTVQKKPSKIIGLKGKRQVGAATSGERGVNTTIVCCTSASGNYIPPMIIFKRKRQPQELEIGAPTGSIVTISDTGYINSELFVDWLKHFHSHVSSSKDDPVLLLLDGHSTHSKNLAAINYARDQGIILLQLPSHTTHRLQPLDVAFFRPLGQYYIEAQEKWLRNNPGKTISQFQVSELLGEAYGRAATVRTAAKAFQASGIWPVDRLIFHESIFSAAKALQPSLPLEPTESPRPSVSSFLQDLIEVSPLPQAAPSANTKAVRNQDAAILTSTPYKDELESKKTVNPKTVKKKFDFESNITTNQKEKDESAKKKRKKVHYETSSSSDEEPGNMSPFADSSDGDDSERELPPKEDVNVSELRKGDFVLIALKNDKNKTVYYVAQVETPKEGSSDCWVIYLKKSLKHRHGFVFPLVTERYLVADEDIQMVLKPLESVGTKRQNSILTFGISFNNLDIR